MSHHPTSENHGLLAMRPIGFVRSCFKDKFATPRQSLLVPSARAIICLEPFVQPEESLLGLAQFSHLWVIFIFHRNQQKNFHAKVHPPRLQGEKTGVFATRSPHRPNAIGLSLLRLESIRGSEIEVSGADFIEGTPVLDIKPYLAQSEAVPNAVGGWVDEAAELSCALEISPVAQERLREILVQAGIDLEPLVRETLARDPRPEVYKREKFSHGPDARTHFALRLYDYDVKLSLLPSGVFRVEDILPYSVLQNI